MQTSRLPRSERGSLLIVAMLLCAIIGISLVSYYKLASSALSSSMRSFMSMSNVDLAEIGIERAMACFYDQSTGTASATAWTGWNCVGTTATRTFSGFTPAPNCTGVVRVYVNYYTNTGGTPVIVVKSTITSPSSPPQSKFIEVTLKPRGLFSYGMVARNTVNFTGNASVDSWNSDPDNNSATAPVAYSAAVHNASGTVGSSSASNGAIDIGNGDVYGSVATGGGTISHGATGTVSGSFSGSGIDLSRVHTDFSATFPAVTLPSPSASNTIVASPGGGISFPRSSDVAAADSKYYYNFASGTAVALSGNNVITVAGNCVWIFNNHSGVTSISTSGNGSITINSTASLIVYTNGNISNTGNGFTNNSVQPANCQIYGTYSGSSGQSITMTGNGSGGSAIYAPNSSFTMTGNGSLKGAVVANTISMTGNAAFHYDEALGNLGGGAGVGVSKWKELQTAAERSVYTSVLNF